ncbi:translation initiation factor IF-2 subunit gamma [Candidatus Micrarchaeota archaeon]|nr:translation initiation factor IF-2 subunit gamma [Candidatus Micrarchaeota archaeon]
MQAEVNIGLLGHVDHGKTSITRALSGVWTDTYSEELKRGISIRIGYADTTFYHCSKCNKYGVNDKCCGKKNTELRKVSFLDAPGHETLMATAISASSIMDGVLLVIAANEKCPQPQTKEHLMVLQALGISKIVVIQNKIDLVSKEKAIENYKEIRFFLDDFGFKEAPIIPMSANFETNISALVETIEKIIPTPKRDETLPIKLFVARSFDINKPGSNLDKLVGGVIGGSVIQGKIKIGDIVELSPGIKKAIDSEEINPINLKVESLYSGNKSVKEVIPGGLVGIGTKLDPAITKGDRLIGNVILQPGLIDKPKEIINIGYQLFNRTDFDNPPLKIGEPLVISIGTATTLGVISKIKGDEMTVSLKRSVCVDEDSKIAISRRVGQRWRLSGFGVLSG